MCCFYARCSSRLSSGISNYRRTSRNWKTGKDIDDLIDGLVQERRNSSALAMELRLSCTNPSILRCLHGFEAISGQVIIALLSLLSSVLRKNIPEELVQYYGCWCPGSLHYQDTRSHCADYSVWLRIFSSTAIWAIWIWRYMARLSFIIAMYLIDIKKTEKFQWPCGLQDFKVS